MKNTQNAPEIEQFEEETSLYDFEEITIEWDEDYFDTETEGDCI